MLTPIIRILDTPSMMRPILHASAYKRLTDSLMGDETLASENGVCQLPPYDQKADTPSDGE